MTTDRTGVERKFDNLDTRIVAPMTQEEYDTKCDEIIRMADEQYRLAGIP